MAAPLICLLLVLLVVRSVLRDARALVVAMLGLAVALAVSWGAGC